MKKNYMKPSLLSETFVTENIMEGSNQEIIISAVLFDKNLAIDGASGQIGWVNFKDGNVLQTINFGDWNL